MKQSLHRNFLKSDTENTIKNTVLASLQNPPPGEDLIGRLNLLVEEEGKTACKVILELLMHRDFGYEEAEQCWWGIVAHHRVMSTSLKRPVSLTVTICDYFSLHGKGVNFLKLIDVHEFEAMHLESQFDFLTGLHNKQTLETALSQEFSRAERYHHKLSVLFLDLDSFKEINERHGHLAGDRMLQHVGRILARSKRSVDIAARFGGDEFVMLLPDTDKKEAMGLAERIRTEISKEIIVIENREVRLTISGGIATYPDDALSGNGVFECADNALYQAKRFGKNIVLLHEPEIRRSRRVELLTPRIINQIDAEPFNLPSIQNMNLDCNDILLDPSPRTSDCSWRSPAATRN